MKEILFISIVSVMFISCRNENYNNLKNENESLRLKLDTLKFVKEGDIRKATIKMMIMHDFLDMDKLGCVLIFNKYKPINLKKFGKVDEQYDYRTGFYQYHDTRIDGIIYTIPQKDKNTENQKKIRTSEDYFTFTPKDTGMHYWSGSFLVEHGRTGRITEFPIYDSIYVLEQNNRWQVYQ